MVKSRGRKQVLKQSRMTAFYNGKDEEHSLIQHPIATSLEIGIVLSMCIIAI